jgi:gluconolactonase
MRNDAAALALLALAFAGRAGAEEARALMASYPEGPLWRGDRLYFAEMGADRITVSDEEGVRPFFVAEGCGPTAIAPYGGGFLVLCHRGARVVAIDAEGREIRRWERDRDGVPLSNPNDAGADGAGGVYFSDPGRFANSARDAPEGRIMHLSADGTLRDVAGPLSYPNGVTVRGGALYVSEHLRGRILRYPIEAQGRLGSPRAFADLAGLPEPTRYSSAYSLSGPDGLEFGSDGALYVALYGEGRLARLSPAGDLLGIIDMPARFLTNIAFGEDGYATTGTFDNRAPFPGQVRIESGLPDPSGSHGRSDR